MTKPITIYTFDGTASVDPTKGFPAEVAKRLQQYDPNTWNWVPVDYKPVRAITQFRPVALNVKDSYFGNPAENIPSIRDAILNTPGKYVLCGLSQGAICVGYMYNEIRYGQLRSRKDDLLAVHTFGDPFRPRGWSVPLHGATPPSPANSTGALLQGWPMSYGTSTGLYTDPESRYWAWANNNDAASATSPSAQPLTSILGHFSMFSTPQSPNKMIMFYDKNTGAPSMALDQIGLSLLNVNSLDSVLKPGEDKARATNQWAGDSLLRTLVIELRKSGKTQLLAQMLGFLSQWWPFVIGAIPSPVFAQLGVMLDPHSQYSEPFRYTAMDNNNKSAVQMAFERLHSLGKSLAVTTTPTNPTNTKPFQLLTFGKPGVFFDASTRMSAWPLLTTAANNTGNSQGAMTVTADYGKRNLNPQQGGYGSQIAAALNPNRVEWVPVSYSSAAFPSVVAVDAAVDRAVSLILAAPTSVGYFLSGHGVGALVATRVHDEFMNPKGRLYARRTQLKGVYNFGSPVRGANVFRGATNSGGSGIASSMVSSLRPLSATSTLLWEFVAPNDVVATSGSAVNAAAYNVMHQNVAHVGEIQSLVAQQAKVGLFGVVPNTVKDLVLSLYSDAPLAHNSYSTWVPQPKTSPGRSAVQLAIDNIKSIAAA